MASIAVVASFAEINDKFHAAARYSVGNPDDYLITRFHDYHFAELVKYITLTVVGEIAKRHYSIRVGYGLQEDAFLDHNDARYNVHPIGGIDDLKATDHIEFDAWWTPTQPIVMYSKKVENIEHASVGLIPLIRVTAENPEETLRSKFWIEEETGLTFGLRCVIVNMIADWAAKYPDTFKTKTLERSKMKMMQESYDKINAFGNDKYADYLKAIFEDSSPYAKLKRTVRDDAAQWQ